MEKPVAPADYEELIRVIHERYDVMSKGYQSIALYLTQNPNDVAVRSVNAIAERCGVHASNFVRFAQALGYTGFKDLQRLFQKRLSTAAPGFEARVKALEGELGARDDQSGDSFLRNLVARDVASLQALLSDVAPDDLTRAAEFLEKADAIYLIGQLRSAPVVDLLRYVLTMLGKRCVLLDPSGGLATHMARTIGAGDVLVAVSFRFYATEVVNVVENVSAKGNTIIAITDSTLSPLAKNADVVFAVPEHEYTFSRSLAAPMCLAQALTVALAARLQNNANDPRIPTVTGR
ncbi:DNA-binding MurR/RpiR family transcriptional regulator [Amaricoccus macauensis]|uniref:DNA-binding MurR/RpiR family transcriptional regulator n=1 Tax=Amaricoccus macauensis TaxID=57001 RepID=A0A840SQV3_9RHOB|nr:DNA-binding MurR/RpiR family transcriptional regulator [Amaricoccus macauensis]